MVRTKATVGRMDNFRVMARGKEEQSTHSKENKPYQSKRLQVQPKTDRL